ncbi:hypothetical protein J6590_074776 [Homalodisca vitripennis]|nr:hypothetical protein J6590_074776 [Homalodisca vitripennis]
MWRATDRTEVSNNGMQADSKAAGRQLTVGTALHLASYCGGGVEGGSDHIDTMSVHPQPPSSLFTTGTTISHQIIHLPIERKRPSFSPKQFMTEFCARDGKNNPGKSRIARRTHPRNSGNNCCTVGHCCYQLAKTGPDLQVLGKYPEVMFPCEYTLYGHKIRRFIGVLFPGFEIKKEHHLHVHEALNRCERVLETAIKRMTGEWSESPTEAVPGPPDGEGLYNKTYTTQHQRPSTADCWSGSLTDSVLSWNCVRFTFTILSSNTQLQSVQEDQSWSAGLGFSSCLSGLPISTCTPPLHSTCLVYLTCSPTQDGQHLQCNPGAAFASLNVSTALPLFPSSLITLNVTHLTTLGSGGRQHQLYQKQGKQAGRESRHGPAETGRGGLHYEDFPAERPWVAKTGVTTERLDSQENVKMHPKPTRSVLNP